ncbi:MAG: hypothetical protein IKS45_01070 [Thermoguttaceae bacterium]|nr:hypothetical protein [Thermoguttaceae bacterium]
MRYGGSASAPTAGVPACQWNTALASTFVQPGSRLCQPPKSFCPAENLRRSHQPFRVADEVRRRCLTTKNTKNTKNT